MILAVWIIAMTGFVQLVFYIYFIIASKEFEQDRIRYNKDVEYLRDEQSKTETLAQEWRLLALKYERELNERKKERKVKND
jgi:hypothetical protein